MYEAEDGPILHSDMGWQYQHETYVSTLAENGFIQSMSRKGNCIDNGATEQVFGHIKDEFFRGRDWQTELPPVSWTSKLKSREWEAFHVCGSAVEA